MCLRSKKKLFLRNFSGTRNLVHITKRLETLWGAEWVQWE